MVNKLSVFTTLLLSLFLLITSCGTDSNSNINDTDEISEASCKVKEINWTTIETEGVYEEDIWFEYVGDKLMLMHIDESLVRFTYNEEGQLVRISDELSTSDLVWNNNSFELSYEDDNLGCCKLYNYFLSNGKIQTITLEGSDDGLEIFRFSWEDENLNEIEIIRSNTSISWLYKHDDKLNPFYTISSFHYFLMSLNGYIKPFEAFFLSRNNTTEIEYEDWDGVQKLVVDYTYNEMGYPSTMKFSEEGSTYEDIWEFTYDCD